MQHLSKLSASSFIAFTQWHLYTILLWPHLAQRLRVPSVQFLPTRSIFFLHNWKLIADVAQRLVYPVDVAKTRLQAIDDPLEDIESDDKPDEVFEEKTEEEQKRYVEGKARRQQKREQVVKLKKLLGKKLQQWGMLTMLLRIVHTEGISGVFHGYGATMIGTFSQRRFSMIKLHDVKKLTSLRQNLPISSFIPF